MFSAAVFVAFLAASSFAAPIAAPVRILAISNMNATQTATSVTWMYQRGNMGACGNVSSDDDFVVGIPLEAWLATSTQSPLCGSFLNITNPSNNVSIIARISDATGTSSSLALSVAAWLALGGAATDMKSATWTSSNETAFNAFVAKQAAVVPTAAYTPPYAAAATTNTPAASSTPAVVVAVAASVSAAPAPTSTFTPAAPSSTFVAPSSTYVAPSPTYVAPSSTYVAPAPAPTNAAPVVSSGSDSFSGQASYYHQMGAFGSCGVISTDDSYVVAIQAGMYDASKCGTKLRITRPSTGKSIVATMQDKCPGCKTVQSIDLSVGAFNALGTEAEGVFPITWSWL